MPYIDNKKFKEILEAGRNGNDSAKVIVQKMMKGGNQDDIDRLVDQYYGLAVEPEEVIEKECECAENCPECAQSDIPEELEPEIVGNPANQDVKDIDISDLLSGETEGLFDEEDYKSISFGDFLKNKKHDANRALKNADYFKAFDADGRHAYGDKIISDYTAKFGANLDDIERGFNDIDKSITMYIQASNDQLDDETPFDQVKSGNAYNDLVDDERAMHSFGRYWDDTDNGIVVEKLKELIAQHGKKNVIAALNILKGDNNSHRDFQNNAIDQNISKYTKSVEKLLK